MSLNDLYQLPNANDNNREQNSSNRQTFNQQQIIQAVSLEPVQQCPVNNSSTTTTTTTQQQPPKANSKNEVKPKRGSKEESKRTNRMKRGPKPESPSMTRFKWTKEMMQVAMNLLKHGCKPKIVSVAVGCSIRTAQKFAESVSPREEGQSYKEYELKRRGRKHKDTNPRLEAIRSALNEDCTKTQVEIAANLKVSNTTVCRDLKKIGGTWKANNNNTTINAKYGV